MTKVSPMMPDAGDGSPSGPRLLSALELLLGSAIVIGHNVFKVLPNEVPILAVLGLISFRLRGGGWSALPFRRPSSWGRVVLIALAAAALRLVLGGVVETLAAKVWPPIVAPRGSGGDRGEPSRGAQVARHRLDLGRVRRGVRIPGFCARGRRRETLDGRLRRRERCSWRSCSGSATSTRGQRESWIRASPGLVLGATFLVSGRNLWACVLAHGFIDSFGIAALYFGWST